MFGPGPTGWQILPLDADDFEESVLKACQLVLKNDVRIGKVPKKTQKEIIKKIISSPHGDHPRATRFPVAFKLRDRQMSVVALARGPWIH